MEPCPKFYGIKIYSPNYHKSSNDFDVTANKMNKKLKAKPLEQCRCYKRGWSTHVGGKEEEGVK
jgi:hypothetical protein